MRIAAAIALAAMLASGAGRAQTPLFDADGGESAARGLRGAFSCPVDKLTELYRGLAPRELPAAMAVETEVLLICAERQEKIQALLEAEIRLRRLMDIPDPPPGSPRISVGEGVVAAPPIRC
ncbi:MAG: hypothetical protein OYG32_14740 [Rhodospirillaceae bacterium]|nr:hypothetical protein [Rhodospirillaceae bacterium]